MIFSSGAGVGHARPRRVHLVLYAVALLLACACVAGGVFVVRTHQDRQDDVVTQERYGDVIVAASDFTVALLNIDYRTVDEWKSGVTALATGDFLTQFDKGTQPLFDLAEQNKAVRTATVLQAAVSTVDGDSATVLVATKGTISNVALQNKPQQENFRFLLTLTRQDGGWKTSNLEPVG